MSSSSSGVPSSHSSCSSTSGPSSKPHRKESNKIFIDIEKPHKILYSWKDAIGNIDFREVFKKDVSTRCGQCFVAYLILTKMITCFFSGFSKTTTSPMSFEISNN